MRRPRITSKQREIMAHVMRAAGEGAFINITQLHKLLSYECAYGSVRTSIRFLVKKEMLVRQPAGTSNLLVPSVEAYLWCRPGSA